MLPKNDPRDYFGPCDTGFCTPAARPLGAAAGRSHSPLAYSMCNTGSNDVSQNKIVHLGLLMIMIVCYYDTAYYLYDPA